MFTLVNSHHIRSEFLKVAMIYVKDCRFNINLELLVYIEHYKFIFESSKEAVNCFFFKIWFS